MYYWTQIEVFQKKSLFKVNDGNLSQAARILLTLLLLWTNQLQGFALIKLYPKSIEINMAYVFTLSLLK